ncbi:MULTISPECIES: HD domain-containing protein [Pseudonocardia]|uniref:HD domain-containing protein n=2 Tax=Pseudonocardia TaxID=1847 RepID=A0A1Y2N5K9_PSEAH|nr:MULTISPECIES: HD domain-containing protein [Pseudonocardia]OSY42742.1 hypothetical protein BG845_00983 [Pseudonocardia autotrophica]TDN77319.1 metal dependent phosphohydrolase [Pseudonocardia autotrophica]BBG01341.1 metal-dependent phosphohydrolase [Pseudonocardia autotrophica]GEC24397.1 metal-dependent phosphohydrolase [Pseudonocardia saturnea]
MISVPATPTARAAADMARSLAPPFLLHHSHRTYLFGALVVDEDLDHEAAFVAAMIHDLGLTGEHCSAEREFGRVGADLAARMLEARGWEQDRIRLVEQAILRHTELERQQDPTLRLVQAGAAIDVAGLAQELIDDDALAAVLGRHPRDGFPTAMRAAYLDEIDRHPTGAFARLEDAVRLSELFAANPIDRRTAVTALQVGGPHRADPAG